MKLNFTSASPALSWSPSMLVMAYIGLWHIWKHIISRSLSFSCKTDCMAMQSEVFSCQIDHISLMSPLLVLWFIYYNHSVIHTLWPLVICYCVLVTWFGSCFDKIKAEGSENHWLVPKSQIWAFEQQILDMQRISQILCKN